MLDLLPKQKMFGHHGMAADITEWRSPGRYCSVFAAILILA
jgi:hypothetical protein